MWFLCSNFFATSKELCFPILMQSPEEEEILNRKRSKKTQKKYDERKKNAKISSLLEEQFQQGKLLGKSNICGRIIFTWISGECCLNVFILEYESVIMCGSLSCAYVLQYKYQGSVFGVFNKKVFTFHKNYK